MGVNGEETRAGAALLIAAEPSGKGRLVEATAVLPGLSAVPARVLTGAALASVTQLVDPADPHAVVAQLRTAARTPGVLLVYVVGQLQLDRKHREPHIALARTSPLTVRYTALPWQWIANELRGRPPGTTAVVADLVADEAGWQHICTESLTLGDTIELYGTVAPPPPKRRTATPAYTQAVAALLRAAGTRPPLAQLHHQAAAQADIAGAILLGTEPPPAGSEAAPPQTTAPVPAQAGGRPPAPATPPDPHPAILEAARAGRHTEAAAAAAAWEQHALRTDGPGSLQAIHWTEVRADLARLAHNPLRSCELWMAAATARLNARQPPNHPDVEGAVDRAHHQWEQLGNPARARDLAPRLLALRRQVPGRQPEALQILQRRLEQLPTTPAR